MNTAIQFTDITRGGTTADRRIGLRSLKGGRVRLVIEGDEEFVAGMEVAARTLAIESEALARIVEAMQPEDLASAGTAAQAQLNAQAQTQLADEFGLLSATEVAKRAGSQARNTSALATRWRVEGRIFGVPLRHAQRYPGFQFDEHGRPLPVIADVVATAPRLTGWGLALWFTGASERLGGARPVDRIHDDANSVVQAATQARAALEAF